VNHGLLVGELLGVDTAEAIEILDALERAYNIYQDYFPEREPLEKLIYPEDTLILYKTFSETLALLNEALDEDGRPKGISGAQLAASPLIETDASGHLSTRSHHLSLLELKVRLDELCRFLQIAIDHSTVIKLG
jgi:hypothetical protein